MEYQNRDKFIELADRLEKTGDAKYKEIIENLRNLEYDDFANTKFATPKMQMIKDLTYAGLHEEADRVRSGEYDQ